MIKEDIMMMTHGEKTEHLTDNDKNIVDSVSKFNGHFGTSPIGISLMNC